MTNISNVKVNIVKKQVSNNMTAVVNCKYIRNRSPTRGHIVFLKIRECPFSRVRKNMQTTTALSNNFYRRIKENRVLSGLTTFGLLIPIPKAIVAHMM